MRRRVRRNDTSTVADKAQNSVYPTPTSLDFKSPVHKDAIQVITSLTKESSLFDKDCHSMPLIVGKVNRKTRNLSTLRRSLKRRRIGECKPVIVNSSPPLNSFGLQLEAPQNSEGRLEDHTLSRLLDVPVIPTPLLSRLTSQLSKEEMFEAVKCSRSTKLELRSSLTTILYPACKYFKASIDTCFLAYSLIGRYCRVASPMRIASRNQLYIAALMIAFKFNEEEDVEIEGLGKVVQSSGLAPETFRRPLPSMVIKMEQKLMKIVDWHISDIVTPLVLIYSFLDCFTAWSPKSRDGVAGKAELVLTEFFLHEKKQLAADYCVVRWVALCIAVSIVALRHTDTANFIPLASAIYNYIYRNEEWKEDDIRQSLCSLVKEQQINKDGFL